VSKYSNEGGVQLTGHALLVFSILVWWVSLNVHIRWSNSFIFVGFLRASFADKQIRCNRAYVSSLDLSSVWEFVRYVNSWCHRSLLTAFCTIAACCWRFWHWHKFCHQFALSEYWRIQGRVNPTVLPLRVPVGLVLPMWHELVSSYFSKIDN